MPDPDPGFDRVERRLDQEEPPSVEMVTVPKSYTGSIDHFVQKSRRAAV